MIQERDAFTTITPQVSYTRGNDMSGSLEGAGGIGGLLARTAHSGINGTNLTHAFYHADGNGNVTYMLDSSQAKVAEYRYDPFGNTLSKSGTLADANVYRFSSKEVHVNSGLYYYGYRFYDPFLQRWPNRDPLGEPGFEAMHKHRIARINSDPNLYFYLRNDPLNTTDPFGLSGTIANPGTFQQVCQVMTIGAASLAAALEALPVGAIVITTVAVGGVIYVTYSICEALPAPSPVLYPCPITAGRNAPPISVAIPRWRPPTVTWCYYDCPNGKVERRMQTPPCYPLLFMDGMICVLQTPFPGKN